ncbi:hypothetical protein CRE_25864 [Caenorhabditis remanei]|uniref:UvrD-like helicase C-terminal domain-containing protein n=1 Tax=Caenorhabditis remanei TaxID=31234 RepID=E3NDS6_CAERE|nr:hypothetical protein CRE_25864 [Caenorhabditis remanei]
MPSSQANANLMRRTLLAHIDAAQLGLEAVRRLLRKKKIKYNNYKRKETPCKTCDLVAVYVTNCTVLTRTTKRPGFIMLLLERRIQQTLSWRFLAISPLLLMDARFWLNLRHPGYEDAPTGFWMPHRTYAKLNGHTLMNEIARQSQSNRNLGLDETLILSMRIFTKDKKALPGRGHRVPEEIRKMFGLHHGHNVVGDSHCLPKALAMGKLWSDIHSCSDSREKKKMASKLQKVMRKEGKAFDNRCRIQMERAMDLLEEAGMDVDQMEHNLEDLEKLAEYLVEYHIFVWEWSVMNSTREQRIVFLSSTMTTTITFIHQSRMSDSVSDVIKLSVNHARKCETKCRRCGGNECEPEEGVSIWCEKFTFKMDNAYALTIHKAQGKTLMNVILDTSLSRSPTETSDFMKPGAFYTAASRVTNGSNFHITQLWHVKNVGELERLILPRQDALMTLAAKREN